MYKKHYSRFLSHLGNHLHFASHSHHAWPDVSREAHLQYWDDSAKYLDDKWEYIFTKVVPTTQNKIAKLLNLTDSKQIAFAPNTHELFFRLLSTFELNRPIRILSTQNEFHSFRRQIQRMEESNLVTLSSVQADEISSNRRTWIKSIKDKLQSGNVDLFFISHVFFDSGIALTVEELHELVESAHPNTVICIDGYHAFGAIPVDLSLLEGKVFYLAGGYKYAQAGEGICFMVVPPGNWRPINTGWFAEIESISDPRRNLVAYPSNGSAFWGATQDPSGFYRFNAVWSLFENEKLDIPAIHDHVKELQSLFLSNIKGTPFSTFPLLNPDSEHRGHFLTFDLKTPEACARIARELKDKGILVDYRGERLRIGFALYHSREDILRLIALIQS